MKSQAHTLTVHKVNNFCCMILKRIIDTDLNAVKATEKKVGYQTSRLSVVTFIPDVEKNLAMHRCRYRAIRTSEENYDPIWSARLHCSNAYAMTKYQKLRCHNSRYFPSVAKLHVASYEWALIHLSIFGN